MPVVRLWPGGSSGGYPGPGRTKADAGKTRGEIKGWTRGASRRLVAFLWSIHPDQLGDDGWAVTLTTGSDPNNAVQWHASRRRLIRKLERAGMTRYHWVVEWTAKGRPHLHMAVYMPGLASGTILAAWLTIADEMGWDASVFGQHIVRIDGARGWLEYLAKHASRGVEHYQRQGMPDGWEKSGRLWGKGGEWPVEESEDWDIDDATFAQYRRMVRRYQRSRLVAVGAFRASRMVGRRHGDRESGRMMGVSGWLSGESSYRLLMLASNQAVRTVHHRKSGE